MVELASFSQNLYCMILYLMVVLLGYNYNVNSVYRIKNQKLAGELMLIACILTAVTYFADSDYFHYRQFITDISKGFEVRTIEATYLFIAEAVGCNYELFRIVVWGSAVMLFYATTKVLDLNSNHALYTLFVIYISLFSYARSSLGMAMLFLGMAILFSKENKLSFRILGLVLFLCSYFFHHSLIIAIGVGLIGSLFKLTKRNIGILCGASLVLGFFVVRIFVYLISDVLDVNDYAGSKLMTYTTSSTYAESGWTFLGTFRQVLQYFCFIVPVFLISYKIITLKLYNDKNLHVELIYNNTALIIVVISLILLALPLGVNVLSYRILYMAMIPVCLCLSSFTDKGIISLKTYRYCLLIGVAYILMGIISNVKHSA